MKRRVWAITEEKYLHISDELRNWLQDESKSSVWIGQIVLYAVGDKNLEDQLIDSGEQIKRNRTARREG